MLFRSVLTLIPRCNAYGLLGTQFLDPLPLPKQAVAPGLRSSTAMCLPFEDVSSEEPCPSDGEDEEDTASEA